MTRLMNSTNEHLGYGLILLSGILWGISGVFVKKIEGYGAGPSLIAFLRVSIAFLLMFVFCVVKFGFKSLVISQKQLFVCAALGLVCHGVYNLFYNGAIIALGISFSTVILYLSPALTLIFSAFIYKEKISFIKIIAIIVNILGAALTVTGGHLSLKGVSIIGLIPALLACLCYSMNSIIGKQSEHDANPFIMSMYSYFFASLILLVIVKPWRYASVFNTGVMEWSFLYALIPTALTYGIYYCGIQKIKDCSKVPIIASVEVVVASIVGVVFFYEKVGNISVLGIVMVLSSLFLMNLHPYRDTISLNAAK